MYPMANAFPFSATKLSVMDEMWFLLLGRGFSLTDSKLWNWSGSSISVTASTSLDIPYGSATHFQKWLHESTKTAKSTSVKGTADQGYRYIQVKKIHYIGCWVIGSSKNKKILSSSVFFQPAKKLSFSELGLTCNRCFDFPIGNFKCHQDLLAEHKTVLKKENST